jgi:peptidoglycan/LPS O-acetylase OafA/YrhL
MTITLDKSQTSRAVMAEAAQAPVRSLNLNYDERLDHLRFLAAFMIIAFHSFPPMFAVLRQIPCDWNFVMNNLGDLTGIWMIPRAMLVEGQSAVGLFLTLSGFLFARITAKSDIVPHKFYLNRLLRIYPLYMCFILLALFLSPGDNPLQSLCLSVLTLQNLPHATAHSVLTPHLWSIAVEFQIYLLFPIVLSEYRSKGLKALFFFIAVAIVLKLLVYALTGEVKALAYCTTFGRLDQFLIGAILGYSFNSFKDKIKHPIYCLLAFVCTAGMITRTAVLYSRPESQFGSSGRRLNLWHGVLASWHTAPPAFD